MAHVIVINDQFAATKKHGDVVVGRVWDQHETLDTSTQYPLHRYLDVGYHCGQRTRLHH